MYLFPKWDALKSVKYIRAAPVNHARALRSRAGASASLRFIVQYQELSAINSAERRISVKSTVIEIKRFEPDERPNNLDQSR